MTSRCPSPNCVAPVTAGIRRSDDRITDPEPALRLGREAVWRLQQSAVIHRIWFSGGARPLNRNQAAGSGERQREHPRCRLLSAVGAPPRYVRQRRQSGGGWREERARARWRRARRDRVPPVPAAAWLSSEKRTGRDARRQAPEEHPSSRGARPNRARIPQNVSEITTAL